MLTKFRHYRNCRFFWQNLVGWANVSELIGILPWTTGIWQLYRAKNKAIYSFWLLEKKIASFCCTSATYHIFHKTLYTRVFMSHGCVGGRFWWGYFHRTKQAWAGPGTGRSQFKGPLQDANWFECSLNPLGNFHT